MGRGTFSMKVGGGGGAGYAQKRYTRKMMPRLSSRLKTLQRLMTCDQRRQPLNRRGPQFGGRARCRVNCKQLHVQETVHDEVHIDEKHCEVGFS